MKPSRSPSPEPRIFTEFSISSGEGEDKEREVAVGEGSPRIAQWFSLPPDITEEPEEILSYSEAFLDEIEAEEKLLSKIEKIPLEEIKCLLPDEEILPRKPAPKSFTLNRRNCLSMPLEKTPIKLPEASDDHMQNTLQ